MSTTRVTPVRRRCLSIKHSYPDAIALFRMGDFYERFDAAAHTLSSALEIALTARSMGKDTRAPMAGAPAVRWTPTWPGSSAKATKSPSTSS